MEVTEETREILIAVAAILQQRRAIRASSISGRMDGAAAFDAGTPAEWVVMLGQDAHPRRVARTQVAQDGDAWHVSGGSRDVEIEVAGRLHDLVLPCVVRSEEHTSELQSLMRISYAVFCLKKKKTNEIQQ